MGLDMYLSANKYVSASDYFDKDHPIMFNEILKTAKLEHLPATEFGSLIVKKNVGYWRKANAIHGWFVDNVADGVDNCQELHVGKEQLESLRSDCIKALANPDRKYEITSNKVFYLLCDYLNSLDQELTPDTYENPVKPTDGFFFGDSDLDDYYYEQLEYTIDLISSLLELPDELSFTYVASW
jgi:hypothetical protein